MAASTFRDGGSRSKSSTPRPDDTQGAKSSTNDQPSVDTSNPVQSTSSGANDVRRSSNEHSPLLSPADGDQDARGSLDDSFEETDNTQSTKSIWYLILVTISIGGLQIAWSVELSNGSPYLLSLGLSKSLMALVWIAGPLTGTLVQPYIGILSDNCRISWGKRKPFMLGGAIATIVSLLFLAWTKEIVAGFLGIFGADPSSGGVKVTTIIVAVIGIYVLDFAINTVQAGIRAFIVDTAPAHQQEAANAMASRMTGLGNIIGYVAGYADLPSIISFFGDTQFKILCVIASIALIASVLLTTVVIPERDPRLDGRAPRANPSVISFFFSIFKSIKRLPPQTKRVCQVQFCSWVGYFPLLFYTSSYIGEIYVQPFLEENPNMSPEELDKLYENATRIGTYALLVNAIVSLSTNVFLPFFIAPTYDSQPIAGKANRSQRPRSSEGLVSILGYLHIPGFTLKRAWFGSLVLFAGVMFCAVLVRSVEAATVLIGLAGITWAMTLWAPWAIISAEISTRDALARSQKLKTLRRGMEDALSGGSSSPDSEGLLGGGNTEDEEEVDQAGVIMGIHNMSIAAPQIVATFGSSLIFKIWQKPRGTPGDHSIAIVMALGGICVLASTYYVLKIQEGGPGHSNRAFDEEHGVFEDAGGVGADPVVRQRQKSGYERVPRSFEDTGSSSRR